MNSVFWTKSSWCGIVFMHSNKSYNTGTLCLYLKDVLDPTAVVHGPLHVQVRLQVSDIVQVPLGVRDGLFVILAIDSEWFDYCWPGLFTNCVQLRLRMLCARVRSAHDCTLVPAMCMPSSWKIVWEVHKLVLLVILAPLGSLGLINTSFMAVVCDLE